MARPRVFVSSTFYDLKHIRSSLEAFVQSLGFEPVLSERGDIAYLSDGPLDDSCYREASAADILILVIGGRYGSESSSSKKNREKDPSNLYESITQKEFETAHQAGVPIFILIESAVASEFRTFLQNKNNKTVKYAHVDSINVFHFIEGILSLSANNPTFHFEKFSEIEVWLREQWSGLFRELLKSRSHQRQLNDLTIQVAEMRQINETLKTYIEAILGGIDPKESGALIEKEEKKLTERKWETIIHTNLWADIFKEDFFLNYEQIKEFIEKVENKDDYIRLLDELGAANPNIKKQDIKTIKSVIAMRDYDTLAYALGRPCIAIGV